MNDRFGAEAIFQFISCWAHKIASDFKYAIPEGNPGTQLSTSSKEEILKNLQPI